MKPVLYGETTSLVRSVVHEAMKMPDIASTAAMRVGSVFQSKLERNFRFLENEVSMLEQVLRSTS